MTDGEILHRGILERPADDTVRLVYADWLEENGQGERAELALRQFAGEDVWSVVFGLCFGGAKPFAQLMPSEHYHSVSVSGGAPARLNYDSKVDSHRVTLVLERGFVSRIELPCAVFLTHAAELFGRFPLETVVLTDREASEWTSSGELHGMYFWYDRGDMAHERHAHHIPREMCPMREGLRSTPPQTQTRLTAVFFPTADEANAALSRACVLYARRLAGLAPLPEPAGVSA